MQLVLNTTHELDGERKVLNIAVPVTIMHCLCTSASLELPGYSELAPTHAPLEPPHQAKHSSYWRHRISNRCTCALTDAELMERCVGLHVSCTDEHSDGPKLMAAIAPAPAAPPPKASA